MKSFFFAWALSFFLLSCGSDSTVTYFKFNGVDYLVVGTDSLTKTETSITGTGKIAFRDALSRNQNSYRLVGTIEDGGKLTLIVHSDSSLNNGLNLVLTRSGATYAAKSVKGATEEELAGVTGDATGDITLQIDVHNDEPHVLVWAGSDTTFEEGDALFNDEPAGKGDGTVWGVELSNATLKGATVSGAKFEE